VGGRQAADVEGDAIVSMLLTGALINLGQEGAWLKQLEAVQMELTCRFLQKRCVGVRPCFCGLTLRMHTAAACTQQAAAVLIVRLAQHNFPAFIAVAVS